MGMARNLERRLEGLLEGFFARVFRSGLQPVEVGRRIVREMDENRTISVNRIYAPNDFRIFVGPEDHDRFGPMEAGLARELSDVVIEAAKEHRWNLMGMPRISFQRDEDKGVGEFAVEASLVADPEAHAPQVSTREPKADDPSETRAFSSGTAERLGLAAADARLVVLDEHGERKDVVSIAKGPLTIGRLSGNDVVLTDSNVSRRHAELRRDQGGWVLADLGSTNGTTVNGKPAGEHRLSHGDRLGFGTTELIFETSRED
jgi:FhaA, N-terminal domain/FHA domain